MESKFAAVKRDEKYSPNHITNDALILSRVGEELKKDGFEITEYNESDLKSVEVEEDFIFSMARSRDSINLLNEYSDNGKFIINSSRSVLNCYRVNLSIILPEAGVSFPRSKTVDTSNGDLYRLKDFTDKKKLWVKRGDVHAEHKEDVSLVYFDEELNNLLGEFQLRKIKKAVIQEHHDGDVVKFYGVRSSPFFYWYYLNGNDKWFFDEKELYEIADKSANILDVFIYGGDAVISETGEITIIDFNDWPSFAPVRDEASKYIAETILTEAEKHLQSRLKKPAVTNSNSN